MNLRMTVAMLGLLAVACAATSTATNEGTGEKDDDPADAEEARLAAGSVNALAFDLYRELAEEESGESLFFSPASVSTALAMTYAGARGATAEQMRATLHFGAGEPFHAAMGGLEDRLDREGAGAEIRVANALWAQQDFGFLDEFVGLNERRYGAGLERVDFAGNPERARGRINSWVAGKTNDRIPELMKPGTVVPGTRLVLTNAVWFKGTWRLQFDPKRTREAPFRLDDGGTTKKKMMQMSDVRFPYGESDRFQALAMPYGDGDVQMVIVLPRDGVRLADLERDLDAETFARWLGAMSPAQLDQVAIPRFELKLAYRLERTLAEMGMPLALSPQADFSGMTGERNLYIDVIAHEAFVQVDEEGTEAAAATGVGMKLTSAPVAPRVFRADHPFLFAIHDRSTDTVLFLGRLAG